MKRPLLVAFAVYSGLTIVVTLPLVTHLTSVIPHDLGDPLLSASLLWWNAHVLPLTERWWDGFAFFPATGTVAFSDHRLGESLVSSPLQWLGCSPAAAYNLTWLATFPLCAIAAHWLGFRLTKRHDAAAICGLAYGFNPYRVAHLEHLELLAAFGLPAALAALHAYVDSGRHKWLVMFGAALVLQGLCTTYYLLFFIVLLAIWLGWFVGWRDRRLLLPILGMCLCAAAILSPVLVGFWRFHHRYGFARSLEENLFFSGDVTSVVTASPLLSVWGWTGRWNGLERQLFPGLTIVTLSVAGAILASRGRPMKRDRLDTLAHGLLALSAPLLGVALAGWLWVWRLDLPWIRISSEAPFKPLSLAVVAIGAAVSCSSRARDAYRRRSPLAFYLLAALLMFICSLGPKPAYMGHQILYEAPYSWLMHLPVFGTTVRAPARFMMLAVLALSTSGALALDHLPFRAITRRGVAVALMGAIIADGWISHVPLPTLPDRWARDRANGFAAVLELPIGDIFHDIAAMYRATEHGRAVVNGSSGFAPPHYLTMLVAFAEKDPAVFDAFAGRGPLLVVVDKRADVDLRWDAFVDASPRATRLAGDGAWTYFALAPQSAALSACRQDQLTLSAVADNRGAVDVAPLTDENPSTWWITPHAQEAGDMLVADLGRQERVCSVAMGTAGATYPRTLSVATSVDGSTWNPVFAGNTAGLAIRAAVESPRDARLVFPLPSIPTRFVRFRLEASNPGVPWVVTELAVRGLPEPAGR